MPVFLVPLLAAGAGFAGGLFIGDGLDNLVNLALIALAGFLAFVFFLT